MRLLRRRPRVILDEEPLSFALHKLPFTRRLVVWAPCFSFFGAETWLVSGAWRLWAQGFFLVVVCATRLGSSPGEGSSREKCAKWTFTETN